MFVRNVIVAITLLISTGFPLAVSSQSAYVNTPAGLLEITGAIGNCDPTPIINGCDETGSIFSLALYKDTLYYNTALGQLKRFKIGTPGSCEVLADVGTKNSMTVDKNGIVYLTDNRLHRYNPYDNTFTTLGTMPFGSAGDLFYYNDKLLLAGSPAGIYEINIADPASSTLYMTTNGVPFYGLISFPESCSGIRYFGLAPVFGGTNVIELDLLNKQVLGPVCMIPMNILDAASVTETGLNTGITIRELDITQACPPATTGSLNITALPQGGLTFTLNNGPSNTTGVFTGLPLGDNILHISSPDGCVVDTTIKVLQGLGSISQVLATNPNNCDNSNGSVNLTATSPFAPLTFTWTNNGVNQSSGLFENLPAGVQNFRVKDAEGCMKDTLVSLVYEPKRFIERLDIRESHCGLNNGWIKPFFIPGVVNPEASINNAPFSANLEYTSLAPGTYYYQVRSGTHCYFDTTIVITNIDDVRPEIIFDTRDQLCFVDNGQFTPQVTGNDPPYFMQVNNGGFRPLGATTDLAPGTYQVDIRNTYDCTWDTFTVINPYPRVAFLSDVNKVNPTCRGVTDGSLQVTVSGTESPYQIQVNGVRYDNGKMIENLGEGEYQADLINADGCIVGTITQSLKILFEPNCVDVYVPNAFTPNDDGLNDRLKPAYSSFIKKVRMKIFNRQGQVIFDGDTWDGRYRGVMQPNGVYIYTVTYTDHQDVQRFLKGHVALIR